MISEKEYLLLSLQWKLFQQLYESWYAVNSNIRQANVYINIYNHHFEDKENKKYDIALLEV